MNVTKAYINVSVPIWNNEKDKYIQDTAKWEQKTNPQDLMLMIEEMIRIHQVKVELKVPYVGKVIIMANCKEVGGFYNWDEEDDGQ